MGWENYQHCVHHNDRTDGGNNRKSCAQVQMGRNTKQRLQSRFKANSFLHQPTSIKRFREQLQTVATFM